MDPKTPPSSSTTADASKWAQELQEQNVKNYCNDYAKYFQYPEINTYHVCTLTRMIMKQWSRIISTCLKVATVKDTIEGMLTHLDELTALVDNVRCYAIECLVVVCETYVYIGKCDVLFTFTKVRMNIETTQTLIPPLMAHTKQLEATFALIDALDVSESTPYLLTNRPIVVTLHNEWQSHMYTYLHMYTM